MTTPIGLFRELKRRSAMGPELASCEGCPAREICNYKGSLEECEEKNITWSDSLCRAIGTLMDELVITIA